MTAEKFKDSVRITVEGTNLSLLLVCIISLVAAILWLADRYAP